MKKVKSFSLTTPCKTCPYRRKAKLKFWNKSHFRKLIGNDTFQNTHVYSCHKKNGSICIGWLCNQKRHNYPSIGLRMIQLRTKIPKGYFEKLNENDPALYNSTEQMIIANYPELFDEMQTAEEVPITKFLGYEK